jgi:hypothetical protein
VEENQAAESPVEQPQAELSIEERFANAMGLEADPQPEVPAEQPEEAEEVVPEEPAPEEEGEFEELEINGELYQVPKELKDGYLRQQDYTRKTQEVAAERSALDEQRKAIEAERQAFVQQVQAQQQNFQLYAQVAAIDSQIAQYQNMDWQQLIDNDPVEAMKLDRAFRELREQRNNAVQQAIQAQQQIDYQRQQEFMQLVERGKAELQKKIPDWSQEKGQMLSEFAQQTYGFTAEEMKYVVDPRHVEVLNDAAQWRQLKAGKPETLKKVANAPKTLPKSAPQPKQSTQDVLKKVIKTSKDKYSKQSAIQKLIESRL